MENEFVGYLLKALELEEIVHLEQAIAADGTARLQLDILRRALIPLEGVGEHLDAPVDLAQRTCEKIRQLHKPADG